MENMKNPSLFAASIDDYLMLLDYECDASRKALGESEVCFLKKLLK